MLRPVLHLAAVLAGLAVAPAVLSAATLQQLSMDEMNQGATTVVRARISGSSAAFMGSTIYTHYKLETLESWKGQPVPEVLVPGGQANGLRQSFPGMPDLLVGAEYVLFLWKSPTTGIVHLMGLGQGVFTVVRKPDGSLTADRQRLGETMLDKSGRKVADQPVSIGLTTMKTRALEAGAGSSK